MDLDRPGLWLVLMVVCATCTLIAVVTLDVWLFLPSLGLTYLAARTWLDTRAERES